ncbi:MAG TPA: response regulator [Verrucomicrobia bacterium]|nr:response regulator [Verrucomicrobiota bacterium]
MARKILIVDDSATARMFVQRCLEISRFMDGAEFIEAGDGNEAMLCLQEHSGEIQMVFTDLVMPNMDGEALARRIMASPRFNQIPVVVISSAGNPAKEQYLLNIGVRAVIKKPVSPAKLASVLQAFPPESFNVDPAKDRS